MKLSIETINLTNEYSLFAHIEQAVRPALLSLEGQVKSLKVQLEDVNGPTRGGVDKRCVIVVVPHAGGPMMFEDVHEDVRKVLALTVRHLERWAGAREQSQRGRQQHRLM